MGRVGSGQPIPGLATAESRKSVDEIARKLGGDPNVYFFGTVTDNAARDSAESLEQGNGHDAS